MAAKAASPNGQQADPFRGPNTGQRVCGFAVGVKLNLFENNRLSPSGISRCDGPDGVH